MLCLFKYYVYIIEFLIYINYFKGKKVWVFLCKYVLWLKDCIISNCMEVYGGV